MMPKKNRWVYVFITLIFTGVIGIIFNVSRNYNHRNFKVIKGQLETVIKNIKSQSFQLTDVINEVNVKIDTGLLRQFSSKNLESASTRLMLEEKDLPRNGIESFKKLQESVLYIRQSVVSYKNALQLISLQNFEKARIQLKFVQFYLNKAYKKAFDPKQPGNFVNPFKRT